MSEVGLAQSSRGGGVGAMKNTAKPKKPKAAPVAPNAGESSAPDAGASTATGKGKMKASDADTPDDTGTPEANDAGASAATGKGKMKASDAGTADNTSTPEANEGPDTDDDDIEEVERAEEHAADQRNRAELLNEGARNYREARKAKVPPPARPEKIQKIWQGLYPTVKSWWRGENHRNMSAAHSSQFSAAQKKIDAYIEKVVNSPEQKAAHDRFKEEWREKEETEKQAIRRQDPDASDTVIQKKLSHAKSKFQEEVGAKDRTQMQNQYRFPAQRLHGEIYALRGHLPEIERMPDDEGLELEEKRLAAKVESAKSKASKEEFLKKLQKIRKTRQDNDTKREGLFTTINIFMEKLRTDMNISVSSVLSPSVRTQFELFIESSKHLKDLYEKVLAELEEPTLEQVDAWGLAARPVFDLVGIVRGDSMTSDEHVQDARDRLALIKAYNKALKESNKASGIDEDQNCIPIGLLQEMLEQWESGSNAEVRTNVEKLEEQLAILDGIARPTLRALKENEAPEDVADSNGSTSETGAGADNVGSSGASLDIEPQSGMNPSNPQSTGDSSSRTNQNLLELDLDSMSLDTDRIQPFAYGNGETEFGPLVATRSSLSDNPRFHRFIVNAGIEDENFEYFRVIKGSDLGPGGAESMPQDKEMNFNIKERKRSLKDNPLSEIGPCVVMPRAEGYVSRSSTKPRQPDTYVRVTYKGRSHADWLSKTEFIQLAGKKYAERQLAIMIPAYYKRQQYFEACKAQRKHPKTRQPLTSEDFENFPWLFPDNERVIKQEEEDPMDVDSDDESPLENVAVNVGAVPEIGDGPRGT